VVHMIKHDSGKGEVDRQPVDEHRRDFAVV
jgi:hypothetical protein